MNTIEQKARHKLASECNLTFSRSGRLILRGATRTGKTRITLGLIDLHGGNWDILVPKRAIIDDWNAEITKWGYDYLKPKLNIYCYQSLHKNPRMCNVVMDEAHHITELNYPIISSKNFGHKTVALSATIPFDKMKLLLNLGFHRGHEVVYKLDQAVNDKVVAPYHVTVVYLNMDGQTKNIEVGPKHKRFYVTEVQGYEFRNKHVRDAMYSRNPKNIKYALLTRMRYIYNLPSKLRASKAILRLMPQHKKTLVFAGSIAHANQLCSNRYHSKTNDRDFKAFKAGQILRLSAVGSISEGVTIPNLENAFIGQVKSNQLHMIQQTGRLLGKTNDPSKVGHVIVLCTLGTQEEKWVKNALGDFDPNNIEEKFLSDVLKNGLDWF